MRGNLPFLVHRYQPGFPAYCGGLQPGFGQRFTERAGTDRGGGSCEGFRDPGGVFGEFFGQLGGVYAGAGPE